MSDDRTYEVAWRKRRPQNSVPTEQVYGILFDHMGRVLVLKDGERYNLPGGRPEKGEDWAETLRRECLEEAQALIGRVLFLGHVRVRETFHGVSRSFAQVRMVGEILELLPAQPDLATGRTYARQFYPPAGAAELLGWGDHGSQQLADAAEKWNLEKSRACAGNPEDGTR